MLMQIFDKHYPSLQSRLMILTGLVVLLVALTRAKKPLVLTLFTLPFILFQAYIVNCMINGNCTKIGWLYVVMNILTAFTGLMTLF